LTGFDPQKGGKESTVIAILDGKRQRGKKEVSVSNFVSKKKSGLLGQLPANA